MIQPITTKPRCPKCGTGIGDKDPAYIMEPYGEYVCEGCYWGRSYRRQGGFTRRRVTTATAFAMMAALLLAIVIFIVFVKGK